MTWVLHITNAQHQFGDLVEPITTAVRGVQELCEGDTELLPIDVIVQALPGRVIPKRGHFGYAPNGTMMQLSFDPANANLEANAAAALADQTEKYGRGLGDRSCMALGLSLGLLVLTVDTEWKRVEVEGLTLEHIR